MLSPKIFMVLPPSNYRGPALHFESTEIGGYSLDAERQFLDNNSRLKYVRKPDLRKSPLDLNVGFDNHTKKDFGDDENHVLKWMSVHQGEIKRHFTDPLTERFNLDFVCFRGLITTICKTVYEKHDPWLICATKYNSVIYLNQLDVTSSVRKADNDSKGYEKFVYWGRKFEQYLSADHPDSEPNISVPVNPNEEYCTVQKGVLRNSHQRHTFLFSAEVDGVDINTSDERPDVAPRYVELKTSAFSVYGKNCKIMNKYRLLSWWLQSYFAGVPKIISGIRDENGIVSHLEEILVDSLFKDCLSKSVAENTLRFCYEFLDFVKNCVQKDDPSVVYQFYCTPGFSVTCQELSSSTECSILDQQFLNNFRLNTNV